MTEDTQKIVACRRVRAHFRFRPSSHIYRTHSLLYRIRGARVQKTKTIMVVRVGTALRVTIIAL
jgi:hypothetical protein